MKQELRIRFNDKIGTFIREDGAILCTTRRGEKCWRHGTVAKDGYLRINFRRKCIYIHRILAETFIPNPDNKPTVDHINRNKLDNSLDNLRWATYAEQQENRTIPMGRFGIRAKDRSAYNRSIYKEYKSQGRCY